MNDLNLKNPFIRTFARGLSVGYIILLILTFFFVPFIKEGLFLLPLSLYQIFLITVSDIILVAVKIVSLLVVGTGIADLTNKPRSIFIILTSIIGLVHLLFIARDFLS